MTILAIDPGINTSIAISTNHTETVRYSIKEDMGGIMCRFGLLLDELIKRHGVDTILIERAFFGRNGHAMDVTNAIINEAHRQGYINHLKRVEYNSMTVRKWLIGRGKRKKGESVKDFDKEIKDAVVQSGFNPKNEHEADAAALICAYQKINHCEGVKFGDLAPHNGSVTKGKSNDKSRK